MEEAKEFLKAIYKDVYPENDVPEDRELAQFLLDFTPIYDVVVDEHRWYFTTFRVVSVRGNYIGYNWYAVTGDMGIVDMGLELDWSTVGFVHPVDVTTRIYKYDEK